jgi:hypothetical protein
MTTGVLEGLRDTVRSALAADLAHGGALNPRSVRSSRTGGTVRSAADRHVRQFLWLRDVHHP